LYIDLGTYVPVPGINSAVLEQIFSQHQNGILGIFDMFSGGALNENVCFYFGVMPYISASIIMTLMQSSFDSLKALKEQGTIGRKKIQQYTRYLNNCFSFISKLRNIQWYIKSYLIQ
jgi:preprotein translocase subunit SecY